MDSVVTRLTFETDDNRVYSSPSIVIDPSGRKMIFYEKYLTTGRTSDGQVSYTAPFTVNVPAGSGTINGTAVSWSLTTVTATSQKIELVYVTAAGVVGIISSPGNVFTKDVILLAYVSSGLTTIVGVENIEKDGRYIYGQKQVLSGSDWVWEDSEYLLNTGENPAAFLSGSLIYVSYKKNGAAFTRIIDATIETTWAYKKPVSITGPNITMSNLPESTVELRTGAGHRASCDFNNNIFPLGSSDLGFSDVGDPYIFIPFIGGSFYSSNIYYPVRYEFYNSSYVLEDYLDITSNANIVNRWHKWTGTLGTKYIGVRLFTNLFTEVFATVVEDYVSIEVYSAYEKVTTSGLTITGNVKDYFVNLKTGGGLRSSMTKTSEFEVIKEVKDESFNLKTGGGLRSTMVKTSEFESLKEVKDESFTLKTGSGLRAAYLNWVSI